MKRIITYLTVLLIALPVMGQINQEVQQRPERFKKHKVIDAFKEGKRHIKDHHYQWVVNFNKFQKQAKADDKKELDSLVSSIWEDNLNQWNKDSKEEFTYDVNENISSFISSMWNNNDLEWDPLIKFDFTFDQDRNLTSLINYWWNPSINQWSVYQKQEYLYNNSNNISLMTTFTWDIMNSLWVQSFKTEYTYDSNQNMTMEVGYEWLTNQWFNSYKDELTYDMANNLIMENNFYWNYGTSQWDVYAKWDYAYDGSNNLISEISYDWDGNQWVNNEKYEYTYNSGNRLIVDIGSNWNSGTNQWVFVYKDEYTYDGNGNRTLGNYYEWISGAPGDWSMYYKDEFIFDLGYDMNDIVGPVLLVDAIGIGFGDIAVAFNNMVIGYLGFEFTDQEWVDTDKVIFYYSNYNNALNIDDEILARSVKLYPNPADDVLIVNSEIPLNKVEVYSILGKKVKEFNTGFNSMRIDNLSNGVYLVRILAEKGSICRKLIKK